MVGQLTAQEQLLITDSGVGDHFDFVGPQPYHEAINYQLGADVLLNITSSQCSAATSNKLYEYLATGRPILVLGALDSVIGRTVAAMGQGLVVAPDDSAGIQRAIRTLHAQWQAGLLPTRRHPATAQFERRELTRKLARLFDGMLKEAC
jgi:glycosyltransferase involved in cell wall biosynthesis